MSEVRTTVWPFVVVLVVAPIVGACHDINIVVNVDDDASGGAGGSPLSGEDTGTDALADVAGGDADEVGDDAVTDGSDAGADADGSGEPEVPACNSCHGDEVSPAPPMGVSGEVSTEDRAVGAHRAHLTKQGWRAEIPCGECHIVPSSVDDDGHDDTVLPAEVRFGPVATADGATGRWNGTTCSNVYCHGATLDAGGTNHEPSWTTVDGSQGRCGTCHGVYPPPPHVEDSDCARCHPTVGDGLVILEPDRHIDGILDVATDCDDCHGSDGISAPPRDLTGDVDTTARGVGAHRSHLGGSGWHAVVPCAECHVVPVSVATRGHLDFDPGAEVVFGDLAAADGAAPAWNGDSCSNTYCHGATLDAGGYQTEPVWTVVDGTEAGCGSCHGIPPADPHPRGGECGTCHPTVDEGIHIADPSRHIDGVVDLKTECNGCHGSDANPAPPTDVGGHDDTSLVGVGAHQSHVDGFGPFRTLVCEDCHTMPDETDLVAHMGDSADDVVFGEIARADGAEPRYEDGSCASYCHGQTLPGGAVPEPVWTIVDGSQASCGSCHGVPPEAPHPPATECAGCHQTVDRGMRIAEPELHVNGVVEVSCTTCHGSDANPAPPFDTRGRSERTLPSVGAHQAHLGESDLFRTVSCNDCHPDVSEALAAHYDGAPAEILFGAVATAGGVDATYSGDSCAVYCHGASLAGGDVPRPTWAEVRSDQAACGACHGVPPDLPGHPEASPETCAPCHPFEGTSPVDPATHVNGVVDAVACGVCHDVPPSTGAHRAHFGGSDAAFLATYGGLGTTEDLRPDGSRDYAFDCGNCHSREAADHGNGSVEIDLYDADAPAGSVLALNGPLARFEAGSCVDVYCHSSGQEEPAYVASPAWVGGHFERRCSGCHGNPPSYPSDGPDTPVANTHIQFADDGWILGHFAGMPGPWHTDYHGAQSQGNPNGQAAAPITCQTCHFASVDPANTGSGAFYYMDTEGDYLLEDSCDLRTRCGGTNTGAVCRSGDECSAGEICALPAETFCVGGWMDSDGDGRQDSRIPCTEDRDCAGFFDPAAPPQRSCTDCHTGEPGAPARNSGAILTGAHVNGIRDVVFDPRDSMPCSVDYDACVAAATPADECLAAYRVCADEIGSELPDPPHHPTYPYWVRVFSRPSFRLPPGEDVRGSTFSVTLAGATYDPETRTCSNVGCHLKQSFGELTDSAHDPLRWGPETTGLGFASCNTCHQY